MKKESLKLKKDLRNSANSKKAKILQRFFKTQKGEYGEGDIFIGVIVPDIRRVSKKYNNIKFSEIRKILYSKIHEERLCALLILVEKFNEIDRKSPSQIKTQFDPNKIKNTFHGAGGERRKIFDFYIKNAKQANNWDLVDLSAYKIVGEYLMDKPKGILYKFAKSNNLWEKRISIISTYTFIKNNQFKDTFKIAEILMNDEHDLIHKAVGWMLREIGKRSLKDEEEFLKKYSKTMPRTMLRYAIERFPEEKRLKYLKAHLIKLPR